MTWRNLIRVGYLGKDRDQRFREWDAKFGKNRWRLAWFWKTKHVDFVGVCRIYEASYYHYLRANIDILRQLISTAYDVYDDAPTNVNSGFDYRAQETNRTHIQDIALRRVVARLGEKWQGDQLLQIRDKLGTHPLSITLSPGHVPFHKKEYIIRPWLEGWWDLGSVECFYQSNRSLQVRD